MNNKGMIGNRVRFRYACCSKGQGKEGKIVCLKHGFPVIFIPECTCVSGFSTLTCPASVQCNWECIEILAQKNQQLLFAFME